MHGLVDCAIGVELHIEQESTSKTANKLYSFIL